MKKIINFSEDVLELVTDTEYNFRGNVEEDVKYKIIVTRYDESNEKPSLFMNLTDNIINPYSKLVKENDPFIVERHFVAPDTGEIIYQTQFMSNKQFLKDYPTLDSFKKACQDKSITRGGVEIMDYEEEYKIQCSLPDTIRVSINLLKEN
jgi:hypothetical protein